MINFILNVYEYNRDGETHTGTHSELEEITGVARGNLYLYTIKVGTRHMKFKAKNKNTSDVHYGTLADLAKKMKVNTSSIREAVTQRDGNMRDYTVKFTGQHIVEFLSGERKTITKPRPQNVVDRMIPKRKPVTPMSEYAKSLFEHSTRHLRKDA